MSSPGTPCPACGFSLWRPLARLDVSDLGFYDDSRFPGRCLLKLRDHHEGLEDVDVGTARAFMADAQRAGRVIKEAVGAMRLNYAVLGNTIPHVHFHLIPRLPGDPIPHRPPWEHPSSVAPNAPDVADRIETLIVDGISSRGATA